MTGLSGISRFGKPKQLVCAMATSGTLPTHRSGQAYTGSFGVTGASGNITAELVSSTPPLPAGWSLSVNQTTDQVTLAWPGTAAPGAAPLGNLGFESGDTQWLKGSRWAIDTTGLKDEGAWSAKYDGPGQSTLQHVQAVPVTPGTNITASCRISKGNNRKDFAGGAVVLQWLDAAYNVISFNVGNVVNTGTAAFQTSAVTAIAPAGSAFVRLAASGSRDVRGRARDKVYADNFAWNHSYAIPSPPESNYNVVIRVRDGRGCQATLSQTITANNSRRGMLAMFSENVSGGRAAISLIDPDTGDIVEAVIVTLPLDYLSRRPIRINGVTYALLQNASGNYFGFPDAFVKIQAEDMASQSFAARVVDPATNSTEVAGISLVTQREMVVFPIDNITTESRRFDLTADNGAYYYVNAINETQAVVGGFDTAGYTLRVFNLASGAQLYEKTYGNDSINAVAISDSYFAVLFYLTGTTEGDTIRVYSLATGDMTAELTIPGFIRTAMFMNDDYIGIGVDDAGNSVEIYALGAGGTSITLDKTIDAFASQKVTLGVETISGSPYASAG